MDIETMRRHLDQIIQTAGMLKDSLSPSLVQATPWMQTARGLMGVKEIPGEASHPVILQMQELTRYHEPDGDDTPWCAAFVGYCLSEAGYRHTGSAAARSYLNYGAVCQPQPGCILVFSRGSGGHVAFHVGEDEDSYHCLGGNQGNEVSVKPYARSRLLGARWPTKED